MMMSRRAKRMEIHHQRKKAAGVNLVSLMDIFTILVFFLLVQSMDVQVLQSQKGIRLPESIAKQKPNEVLVVMVDSEHIMVNGAEIASVEESIGDSAPTIAALHMELQRQARRARRTSGDGQREITIMGDKEIPYTLLKKIMLTCSQTNYGRISLAVISKGNQEG